MPLGVWQPWVSTSDRGLGIKKLALRRKVSSPDESTPVTATSLL